MKEIKFSYYEVSYDPNDDLGGYHSKRVIGRFTNNSDATKFAKGKGSWGANADVKHVIDKIVIWESYDEAIGADKEVARQQALKKLTKAEREALGLE